MLATCLVVYPRVSSIMFGKCPSSVVGAPPAQPLNTAVLVRRWGQAMSSPMIRIARHTPSVTAKGADDDVTDDHPWIFWLLLPPLLLQGRVSDTTVFVPRPYHRQEGGGGQFADRHSSSTPPPPPSSWQRFWGGGASSTGRTNGGGHAANAHMTFTPLDTQAVMDPRVPPSEQWW